MTITPSLQVARKWGKDAGGGQEDETLDYSAPTPSGSEADLKGLAADMSKASLVDQEEGEEDDSDEGEPSQSLGRDLFNMVYYYHYYYIV